jgi:hypothetical protein
VQPLDGEVDPVDARFGMKIVHSTMTTKTPCVAICAILIILFSVTALPLSIVSVDFVYTEPENWLNV